jgi:hypothetical protein
MNLDERLKNVHRRESKKAAEADEAAEKSLDAAAAIPREHQGPGATKEWVAAEQRRHHEEAAGHRHKARVHRRRAQHAGQDGSGDLLLSPDEHEDSDYMVENRDLVSSDRTHRTTERLPRED